MTDKNKNIPQTQNSIDQMTYEEAFTELEKLIFSLENEKQSLEESLAMYESGQLLARHCAKLLDHAELRIHQISGENIIPFEG